MNEIEAVGARAHEMLVALRGTKPYIKQTTDAAWIAKNGTDEVNLAQCAYDELPSDWKRERDAGAEIAVRAVRDALQSGRVLDAVFIEEVSKELHDKWLERNAHRAGEVQMRAYADMPESEKEKDRCFVRAALGVVKV
jgi:hypothetical protein